MAEPSEWAKALVRRIRERYHAPGNEHVMEFDDAALALDAARKEALEKAAETVHAMDPAHYVRWGSDAAATALDTAEDRILALIDKPPAPPADG